MKQLFLYTLIMFMLSNNAFGQIEIGLLYEAGWFKREVKTNDKIDWARRIKPSGFSSESFGLYGTYYFNEIWQIYSAISWSQNQDKYIKTNSSLNDFNWNFDYLVAQNAIQIKLPIGYDSGLNIQFRAGVMAAYMTDYRGELIFYNSRLDSLGQRTYSKDYGVLLTNYCTPNQIGFLSNSDLIESHKSDIPEPAFKRFDLGFTFGTELSFEVFQNFKVNLGCRISRGILNVEKNNNANLTLWVPWVQNNGTRSYNFNGMLSLRGLLFTG